MQQRISLITLGVDDIAGAAAFYAGLGWKRVETPDRVVVFDLIGQALGLYPLDKLAQDIGLARGELGHGAMTLGYNCRDKQDVAATLALAQQGGAEILKPAADVFWGGHHGYFRSPDGTIWEVAFNPFSKLREDGAFCWNGYG